jgi:hypothetical protein
MTILDLTLDKNDFTAESPKRCATSFRRTDVALPTVPAEAAMVSCAVPECCTFCRRGDSSGSNKGNGRGL